MIVPKPTVRIITIGNKTLGDKLLLRCDVNITKGISGSVNIEWKINGTRKGKLLRSSLHNVLNVTLSSTSSLKLTDNNTVYYCQAVINASQSVKTNTSFVLKFNVSGKHNIGN